MTKKHTIGAAAVSRLLLYKPLFQTVHQRMKSWAQRAARVQNPNNVLRITCIAIDEALRSTKPLLLNEKNSRYQLYKGYHLTNSRVADAVTKAEEIIANHYNLVVFVCSLPVAGFTLLKTAHRTFHCNQNNPVSAEIAHKISSNVRLTFLPFRYRTLPSIKSIFKAKSSRLSAAGKLPSHAELVDLRDMRTQKSSNIPSRIVIALSVLYCSLALLALCCDIFGTSRISLSHHDILK